MQTVSYLSEELGSFHRFASHPLNSTTEGAFSLDTALIKSRLGGFGIQSDCEAGPAGISARPSILRCGRLAGKPAWRTL